MARSDDYIVNDSGSVSPYDIIVDDLGLAFFGENPVSGKFGPGPTTAKDGPGETAIIFNDFSNGMGMAYSGVPNTYAYAINGYARTPNKFMPGGRLTEISFEDSDMTDEELGFEIRAALEWDNDIFVGAGGRLVRLNIPTTNAITTEYMIGADCQIDSAIIYNNIPLWSTDQVDDNWQYLTGWNSADQEWQTANSVSSPRTGADNYVNFTNPVFLQKMRATFQEVDGIGGFRLMMYLKILLGTQQYGVLLLLWGILPSLLREYMKQIESFLLLKLMVYMV